MNTNPAVLAALLSLLFPGTAAAGELQTPFERRCEREMTPRLEVSSREAGVNVYNTVSSQVLNARVTYNSAGQLMLGMTAGTTRAEIDIDGTVLRDPAGGRECLAPRVSVQLGYQPMEIYVAREFHPVSCSYRAVYAHEMRHVELYRQHLPEMEQLVRTELVKRYAGRPLYAAAGEGLAVLEQDIDNWLRPLIRDQLKKVERLQQALDSPEESFRLSHACQGEVASRMGSSF
jgi:hypothetical protein